MNDLDVAIRRVEESKDSHVKWRDHLNVCTYCQEFPPVYVQTAEEHQQIIDEYDVVLRVLRSIQSVKEEFNG